MKEAKYEKERPPINAETKRSIEVEAGHSCSVKNCEEHTYLEIHHINENREDNNLSNLILLCDKHHKMAHAKIIDRKALKEYKKLLNDRIAIKIDEDLTFIAQPHNDFAVNCSIKENEKIVHNEPEQKEALRNIEDTNHIKFIDSLPEEKMVVYQNAKKKWDTGITSKMREGNYDVIEFMKLTWLKLSEFYKSMNFEEKTSIEYIEDYTKSRFDYHWSKHMPNGEFKSGTIVYVMVGADVIEDLEKLIIDLVSTVSFYNDNFNYLDWKARWET